jgi:hypothetical protein
MRHPFHAYSVEMSCEHYCRRIGRSDSSDQVRPVGLAYVDRKTPLFEDPPQGESDIALAGTV